MKNFNFFEKLWEHGRTLRRVGLVLVMCLIAIPQVWGYGSSAGTVVYFDMQDCSGFGTPYFRVGRTSALSRSYQLSLVGGTKYLYSYSLGQWDNYDAFSVANGKGWTGDDGNSTIYQPHSGQYENGNNKTGYDGDKIITKQTTFMSENISGNYYIKIGSATGSLSYNCQYYDRTNGSLPTYSISYDAPSNGTLTVQQYTGSSYTALASGTTGLKPTQIIKVTTSPSTHYGLASLTVTGATQIDGGDTYYITGNCTVTATFAPKWTIKGGNSNDTDGSDAMGDWATYNNLTYTGTANTYSGTITLAANTTYRFKVVDRDNGTPVYWGYGGSDGYHLSFVGQSGASEALGTNASNQENLALMSAGAGTYTFTWNSSSHTLTVDFPTVTHPSTDYIYYKDYDNYDSHGDIVAHIWGGSTASTGDQRMPVVNSFNFDGTTYFYAALGNNTKAIFAGSDNTATYKTEDLNSASSKKGKYYDKSSNSSESTRWQPFTATLTLDHQAPNSNTPSPNSVTVTYGASTNINTDIISTKPSKSNYTWGGYYTQLGGEGVQIINTSDKIPSNLDGYTSSGKWIKTGSSVSATIYAKFTQDVTLDKKEGSANGSATAAFNGVITITTVPTYDGCTVAGYYKETGRTNLVMDADGTMHASVTDRTNSSAKWINTGGSAKLYTKWKLNAPTITNECNKVSISTTVAGTTIYYTTDGTTPTKTSSVYSSPIAIAANTTVKAFAVKSDYVDSDVATEVCNVVTTYSVNYNANLDGTSGSTASQTGHCSGDVETTSACGFTKSNYKFKWWNTAAGGGGEDFYPGESVTFTSSANIPLYAQWEQVESGWAYWNGNQAASSSPIDVTGNGVTMRLTKNSVDWNNDFSKAATTVSKYSGTQKKANVLAMDAANEYLQVHFTDGSPIKSLKLGTVHSGTESGDKKVVVIYSTTSDFSTGEHEEKEISIPYSYQSTKSITDFSPSTSNKYLYARIYRSVSTAVYSYTGPSSGGADKMRIYSIKAQKGCLAPTTTFAAGEYTIDGDALDLRTLISNGTGGALTFEVTNDDDETGATIGVDGYSLTASAAGTCTVTATQAAYAPYCEKEMTATITVSDASTWTLTIVSNNDDYGSVDVDEITDIPDGTETSSSSNKFTVNGTTVTATATTSTGAYTYAFTSWSNLPATVTADATVTANFSRTANSYTITLDKQVASNTPTGSVSATYGSAMPSIATLPSHANYTFGGFYTNVAGGGTCYYNGSGVSQQNSDFTSTSTLYAKFTQSVTLDANGGSEDGSATATYAGTVSSISAPEYSGHMVDGYYAESGCSNLVMTDAGVLQTSVTDGSSVVWTDASGKWKHAAASTLYAHWKCDAPTVTCTDNVVTMTVPSGATVYYTSTTDGSTPADPTSSSTAYDPSNKPTISANTKIKAIAIQSGCTNSNITSATCSYTAFSTSINLEQGVLDNKTSWSYTSALTSANISYDLSSGCSLDTLNDAPSDKGVYKVRRNEPYLGLKVKSSGKYIQINLKADKTLKVKFGYIAATVDVTIDDVAQTGISSTSTGRVYELASSGSNRVVKLATSTDGAVVIKQIMIGEAIESVTLPAKITLGATTNGSISVDNTIVDVGSDVAITVTPSSGYELDELTVTRDTIDNPEVSVINNEFTMPNNNVTINATFVLSGYAITLGDHDNGTVAITDGSSAITSAAEDATVYLEATPNTGYTFGSWKVVKTEGGERVSVTQSWKPSAHFTMPGEAVTVSAEFAQVNYAIMPRSIMHFRYTVQVGEAGAVDGYARAHYGDVITLAQSSIADGYHLKTWGVTKTESGDPIEVVENQFTMPAEDVTINPIVGKWYTVTFNSNGGSTTPDPITQTAVDGAITMPAAPTKSGYTFVNWMIGGTTVAAGGSYTPPTDVTAYATWKADCAGGGCETLASATAKDDHTGVTTTVGTVEVTNLADAKYQDYDLKLNSSGYFTVTAKTGYSPIVAGDKLTVTMYNTKGSEQSDGFKLHSKDSETTHTAAIAANSTGDVEYTLTEDDIEEDGKIKIFRTDGDDRFHAILLERCGGSGSCYYVTYNGNGAAGGYTNDETAYSSGTTVTVATNENNHFTHPGYSFTGWNTAPDGSGTGYDPDDDDHKTFAITGNTTLYAQWTPATLYFTRAVDGDWTDPLNWEVSGGDPGCIPTIEHDVVIQGKVTLYGPYAEDRKGHGVAKSVRIEFGKNVEIWTEGGLIVAEDIKAKHAVDGEYEATTPDDLSIETTILGNGTLITGEENSTTQALYKFRTKAFTCYVNQDGKRRKYYYNQYCGIPFQPIDPMTSYYGCTIYEYGAATDSWITPTTEYLQPFVAYNLLRKNAEDGDDIWLRGTLNLPGIDGVKLLECGWRADDTGSTIDATKTYQDFMFANSWTAPIDISSLDEDDCSANLVQSIYMFNTGYEREKGVKEIGNKDGQWSVFPFKAGKYMKDAVIPGTQAFLVTAMSSGASLTLKYGKHVYYPALEAGGANNFPTRAPKRAKREEIAPNKLLITVLSDNIILDNMYIFEREDFTEEFDNGWDGTKIIGSTRAPQLYTRQGNNKMEVAAVPEMEGLEIGFVAGTDTNSYAFEFEYLESEPLYLYDRETMEFTPIENKGTYSFTTEDNLEHARFVLTRSKSPQIATGFIDGVETSNKEVDTSVRKIIKNDHVYILRGGHVYSIDGSMIK